MVRDSTGEPATVQITIVIEHVECGDTRDGTSGYMDRDLRTLVVGHGE